MSRPSDRCHTCRGTGCAYPDFATSEILREVGCAVCAGRGVKLHPRPGDRVKFIDWDPKRPKLRVGGVWEVLEAAEGLGSEVRMCSVSSGYTRRWAANRVAVVETVEERVAAALMGEAP